jgi:Spondin_N
MKAAGDLVYTWGQADGFFIDQEHWTENYVYIPPVDVSFDFPFLNAIAGISPSPDWYSGFYLFDTVDEYDRTFWHNFTLFTYPWDAGTDAGQSYTAEDRDLDPPMNVARFFPNNVPDSGAFLSPDGKQVPPVGEFNCELYVCPVEDPNCVRPNWPPKNYCDVFKYPNCATYCDPSTDEGCEECKGNGYEAKSVYLFGCCENGHEPRHGSCGANSGAALSATGSVVPTLAALLVAGIAASWR